MPQQLWRPMLNVTRVKVFEILICSPGSGVQKFRPETVSIRF